MCAARRISVYAARSASRGCTQYDTHCVYTLMFAEEYRRHGAPHQYNHFALANSTNFMSCIDAGGGGECVSTCVGYAVTCQLGARLEHRAAAGAVCVFFVLNRLCTLPFKTTTHRAHTGTQL